MSTEQRVAVDIDIDNVAERRKSSTAAAAEGTPTGAVDTPRFSGCDYECFASGNLVSKFVNLNSRHLVLA